MSDVGVAHSAALNEQELWRDMVRWSGGLVHEEDGLLFVAGPSRYLRVMIRLDGAGDGASAVRRAGGFFAASEGDHIVLVREPDDADLAKAALAAGYTPGWTERPMALYDRPEPSPLTEDIDVRVVSTTEEVLAYGMVVAEANEGLEIRPAFFVGRTQRRIRLDVSEITGCLVGAGSHRISFRPPLHLPRL